MSGGEYKEIFKDKTPIKILLLGEGAVGKTSLRKRYMGEGFKQNYMMTLGAEFSIKVVDNFRLQIWDLSGQHTLSKIRRGYYKGAKGVILVFDISRPDTFHKIQAWIDEMHTHQDTKIPMILVGNKADLRETCDEPVQNSHAFVYAKQLSEWSNFEIPYFEASAMTGLNVEQLFSKLVEEVGYLTSSQIGY